jgi:hypothetical protein
MIFHTLSETHFIKSTSELISDVPLSPRKDLILLGWQIGLGDLSAEKNHRGGRKKRPGNIRLSWEIKSGVME